MSKEGQVGVEMMERYAALKAELVMLRQQADVSKVLADSGSVALDTLARKVYPEHKGFYYNNYTETKTKEWSSSNDEEKQTFEFKVASEAPFFLSKLRICQMRDTTAPITFLPNAGLIDVGGTATFGLPFIFKLRSTAKVDMDNGERPSASLEGPLHTELPMKVEQEFATDTSIYVDITPLDSVGGGGDTYTFYVTIEGVQVYRDIINEAVKKRHGLCPTR